MPYSWELQENGVFELLIRIFLLLISIQSPFIFAGTFTATKTSPDSNEIKLTWGGYSYNTVSISETIPSSASARVVPEIGYHFSDNSGSKTLIRTAKGAYIYRLYECRVAVSTGQGTGQGSLVCDKLSSTQTVLIGVDPPEVHITSDSSQINEGASTIVRWTSSRATSCSSPELLGVSAPNGSAVYSAPTVLVNDVTRTVSVKCNGEGGEVTASKPIVIKAVNDAPAISVISNVVINEDTSSNNITFTVSDEETVAQSLTVTAISSDATLLPNTGIVFGGSAGSRTIKLTPAANKFGVVTVTVRVSDGLLSASRSFTLTVNPVNDKPSIGPISNVSITQTQEASSPVSFSISDLESPVSSLTVTAISSNKSLVADNNLIISGTGGTRTIVVKPTGVIIGSATITVTVKDPEGATESRVFIFTRTASPPELNVSSLNSAAGTFTLSWRFGTNPVSIVEILPGTGVRRFVPELSGYNADPSGSKTLIRDDLNGTYKYELYNCRIVISIGDRTGQGNLVCDQLAATRSVVVSIPAPSITLISDKEVLGENESLLITWDASYAKSCKKFGFSGVEGISGNATWSGPDIIVSSENKTFSLECEGAGGISRKNIDVRLNAPLFEWNVSENTYVSNSSYCTN